MQTKFFNTLSIVFLMSMALTGCKKLTQVPEPVNTVTTSEAFGSDGTAISAIAGIYNDLASGGDASFSYGNGGSSVYLGMCADELRSFRGNTLFENNMLTANSGTSALFWAPPYFDIYLANAALEGLSASTGVTASVKQQLTGEACFFRAFCHFYLVNLYGEVPYLTTTAYAINDTARRQPVTEVYAQIIADLLKAQSLLSPDYLSSDGSRIRINQYAATAFLARAYLYNSDWRNAEMQASTVIDQTDMYMLETDPNKSFLIESHEAILQWQTANQPPYATAEGNILVPYDPSANPNYYLRQELLTAFEPGDLRFSSWVDSVDYNGTRYYYPYKYKVYTGVPGNVQENQVVLRLAEQYLIRAEARARLNKLDEAITDLNIIRERAQLPDLPAGLSREQVLSAVAQERRIELFSEWGHRWLDLKRTGQADAVLQPIKPTWRPTAVLFPIPAGELINNASLTQNPGY